MVSVCSGIPGCILSKRFLVAASLWRAGGDLAENWEPVKSGAL